MNIAAIEQLRDQYRSDPSIIFAMPKVVQEVSCGTAMCYAGQVCINAGHRLTPSGWGAVVGEDDEDAMEVAQRILGLNSDEAKVLFLKPYWPDDLRDQPDTPHLAAERLQRFLDSDGWE